MDAEMKTFTAEVAVLVSGKGAGEVLFSDVPLSFWGGVDPETGDIIDRNHPLHGQCLAGRILALPAGRGSCTGSSVMMQLILNGKAPAALVFARREDILTLGVIVADEMFGQSVPVVHLGEERFEALRTVPHLHVSGSMLSAFAPISDNPEARQASAVALTPEDRAMTEGVAGEASAIAMRIILRMADVLEAQRLIDVTQAHIDGCIYTGPASLEFAERLVKAGGRVKVPTTLNAISVDQMNWQRQGTDEALARPASALADAYVALGAKPSFTCAPYLLSSAPARGEDIVWAESNAVVFANSVLGARTMKYPDYLDICVALTGRAPLSGCHISQNRHATRRIRVPQFDGIDDSFYPLLGYQLGLMSPGDIPLVEGLEDLSPTTDDLKALSAAFGTTSGAPMFHIHRITPEAGTVEEATGGRNVQILDMRRQDLAESWRRLNGAEGEAVDLVSLGNPHFSVAEFERLTELCRGRRRNPQTRLVVTAGRDTHAEIAHRGLVEPLRDFGADLIADACWCTVTEPVIPPDAKIILTNSGKFAHYGPGLTGRTMRFASLAACVEAAVEGRLARGLPAWLEG